LPIDSATIEPDPDVTFRALADPIRRRLLDRLNAEPGLTLRELVAEAGIDRSGLTRQSVSKHLAVLEGANLVTSVRRGREKLHYLNAVPIHAISDRWLSQYDESRAAALANLKSALETAPMSKPEFVYTTYIRATPEQVWRGLTEPEFTQQYWACTLTSDWKKGSQITWRHKDAVIEHPEQVVLEADPPRRLSYTWHTFTEEWAASYDFDQEQRAKWADEPRSRVSFDIEPGDDGVTKLTVTHDNFAEGSEILAGVSQGWPAVLASMKTLLETGTALPAA
jgi:uncharacterized protein YndB with AHSA1/START domain/DNA-binding transcriptional ArsR family regulator